MSEHDDSRDAPRGGADQTLLGVAPPRFESSAESPLRKPVFVRAGTSVADVEPPPVPPMALPSRPPLAAAADSESALQLAAGSSRAPDAPWQVGQVERARRFLGGHPALWMLLAPALVAVAAVALLRATAVHHGAKLMHSVASAKTAAAQTPELSSETSAEELSKLASRPPESLNARELALLADAHSERLRASAKALRSKVEANPALGKDPALQSELLRLADDTRTSADALAGMAALAAPIGADLLYEVWTRTPVRSDTTDLARALAYSTDVLPKASPALSVALELRLAESCEQYQVLLPKALKDGDRRSTHLLLKLSSKHGCGPKKNDDCYACLREQGDELKATINAVKSRRPPDYGAP
jgi:hypothetical protein